MPDFTPAQIDKRIQADPEMQRLAKDDETKFLSRHAEIYNEFGYHPDGTPHSTAKKAIKWFSKLTDVPEPVVQFGASAVLPALGTAAGMAVGASGGPLGMAIGASGGSVLGEAGNSLLGVSDPMSKTDMALAAGAPLVGSVIAKAGPALIKTLKFTLPGVGAGLNELAGEKMAKVLSGVRVTKEDVNMARTAMNATPDFKMSAPSTKAIFNEESASVARQALLDIPGSDTYLTALNKVVASSGVGSANKVSFKDLMTLEQGFNRIKGSKPDEIWAAASGKIIDDIEAAATDPTLSASSAAKAKQGLEAFKSFIAINRKHQADETIVKMFTPGTGAGRVLKPVSGDSDMILFDRKLFNNMLANDTTLTKAFSPPELAAIKDSIKDLGYISKPPSTGGDVANLAKRYGVGGMMGWLAAGPMGAFAGAGIEEIMRKAISSDMGRKAVKHLAKEGRGRINALELQSMLGQITAGVSSGAVAGVSGMGDTTLSPNQE